MRTIWNSSIRTNYKKGELKHNFGFRGDELIKKKIHKLIEKYDLDTGTVIRGIIYAFEEPNDTGMKSLFEIPLEGNSDNTILLKKLDELRSEISNTKGLSETQYSELINKIDKLASRPSPPSNTNKASHYKDSELSESVDRMLSGIAETKRSIQELELLLTTKQYSMIALDEEFARQVVNLIDDDIPKYYQPFNGKDYKGMLPLIHNNFLATVNDILNSYPKQLIADLDIKRKDNEIMLYGFPIDLTELSIQQKYIITSLLMYERIAYEGTASFDLSKYQSLQSRHNRVLQILQISPKHYKGKTYRQVINHFKK